MGKDAVRLEGYPDPIEVKSACFYNFKVFNGDLFGENGEVKDLDELKTRLVNTMKKPITSEETDRGLKQQMISKIRIFVVFHGKEVIGSFWKRKAEEFSGKNTVIEYILGRAGARSKIIGKPTLSTEQEKKLFSFLINEINQAGPFDDLGDLGKTIENAVVEKSGEDSDIGDIGKTIKKNVRKN